MKTQFTSAILVSLLLPAAAHAATLVTYNFNANGNATNAGAFLSGGTVTNGGGLTGFNVAVNPGAYPTNVLQVNPPNASTNLADAITTNSFFSITLTPADNVTPYTIGGISFEAARGGPALNRGVTIRSNVTGTTNLFQNNSIPTERSTLGSFGADLRGQANLTNFTGPVTFNFYIHTPQAGNSLEFDNIVFDSVPEPSAALLGALGCLALLRRKRA